MAATERHVRRRRERPHASPTPAPRSPVPGAVIEFQNVTKIYPSGDTGLDDVSFAIQPGEFVFLVGQSGSGKSTTMRLLIKETEATSGTIRVAGRLAPESRGAHGFCEIQDTRGNAILVNPDHVLYLERRGHARTTLR